MVRRGWRRSLTVLQSNWRLIALTVLFSWSRVYPTSSPTSQLSAQEDARTLCTFFFLFRAIPAAVQPVPRLGVELELQLPAYTTAPAMPDLSCVWDLHHSSWQRWILNSLSEAKDWTCVLMDPSKIHFHCTTTETPTSQILNPLSYNRNSWLCIFRPFPELFVQQVPVATLESLAQFPVKNNQLNTYSRIMS